MSESRLLTPADCHASRNASTWSTLVATTTLGRSLTAKPFPFVNRSAMLCLYSPGTHGAASEPTVPGSYSAGPYGDQRLDHAHHLFVSERRAWEVADHLGAAEQLHTEGSIDAFRMAGRLRVHERPAAGNLGSCGQRQELEPREKPVRLPPGKTGVGLV